MSWNVGVLPLCRCQYRNKYHIYVQITSEINISHGDFLSAAAREGNISCNLGYISPVSTIIWISLGEVFTPHLPHNTRNFITRDLGNNKLQAYRLEESESEPNTWYHLTVLPLHNVHCPPPPTTTQITSLWSSLQTFLFSDWDPVTWGHRSLYLDWSALTRRMGINWVDNALGSLTNTPPHSRNSLYPESHNLFPSQDQLAISQTGLDWLLNSLS